LDFCLWPALDKLQRMEQVDTALYILAAGLQLAAIFYAIRMARDVNDARPWLVLFAALLLMFLFRLVAFVIPLGTRLHIKPWSETLVSSFLLVSLLYTRRIAVAERESKRIADRRTAERDESENRYRSLVELSPDVMFVNAGGKIAYVNAAAVRFFGAYHANELLGRSPLEFTAPESRPLVEARIRAIHAEGECVEVVVEEWLKLDHSRVTVEAAAALVPWRGEKGIQVILRDISERRRAEEEKTHLLASERAARGAAEHASRMKDEFLATLSHELRTPLNAILGWSQILKRIPRDQEEEMQQGLDTIERNARIQTKLIEDLLDMSRIISGKLRLDVQRLSPLACIEAAIETVQPSAEAKEIRLEQMLDPQAGPIVGDPNRLQQIVWNLLSNAVKFTPRGGKVQVVLQRVNSQIEISVADTGQGIEQEFLPFVFDRFRQADATTTRWHGGLGIGLSIVKQLVELHGGTVRVESAGKGRGTTFSVALPLSAVHAREDGGLWLHPACSQGAPSISADVDLSGLTLLVVDDEPDTCRLIRRVLEDYHATVITASSVSEALPLLESSRPDVLVSDIGMPDIDGYEFLRRVRALGAARGGKIPAIALTAFARSEDRTRALMAGYSVHVSKPVEPQELVATVASLAGRTGGAERRQEAVAAGPSWIGFTA
jgi:PAS domain S-box-containing protein